MRPLLPSMARVWRPRADDRRTINGILYVLTTECRWMDLPYKYGDEVTAWGRLRRWAEMGVWKSIMRDVIDHGYASWRPKVDSLAMDSGNVATKKGGPMGYDDRRRVKGSKVEPTHSLPLGVAIGPANEHD